MTLITGTREGTVPHRDMPARTPWPLDEYRRVCIMLMCSVSPCRTRHPLNPSSEKYVEEV
eukprot:6369279-Prymnesium_polylepis.1